MPQEVAIEPFETVLSSIKFSRGLFGKPQDSFYINSILKQLSLWEKRNTKIIELSGGINSENINEYCIKGVDGISMGALTHNIKSKDISLDLK